MNSSPNATPPPPLSDIVLDSSAVLAYMFEEPGADLVERALPGALLSSVNLAEIITKLCERGVPAALARDTIDAFGVEIIAFGAAEATLTGDLRNATASIGLSLGDRACLALARLRGMPVMTADRAWGLLEGFDIRLIRGEPGAL